MEFYESPDFSPYLEKMQKGELTLEEILNTDSIIDDLKSREQSDFLEFFTNKQIKKLIDYSTRFPKTDEHYIGYKFPFNSTEILCSENKEFFNKFMSGKKIEENAIQKKRAKDFIKKMHKGGFFEVVFKAIKKAEGANEDLIENLNNDNTDIDNENDDDEDNNNRENVNLNKNNNNNLIFNYFRGSLDAVQESQNEGKMIYENIDYLLGFLKESEETRQNYVLDGYFHRILSNLISMDQKGKLIKYLLNYPKKEEFDVLNLFVKNMRRKSKNMINIIQKLLLYKEESNNINIYHPSINQLKNGNKNIKEQKTNLLKLILNELDNTNEQEKYECICDSLCGLMTKTQFLENEYDTLNPLEYIYNILLNNKNNNQKSNYILTLLLKINENILKLFDSRCTQIVEEEPEDNNDLLNIYNSYNYNAFNSYGNNRYSTSIPEDNRSKILENILLNLFDILEKTKFEFLSDFGKYESDFNNEFMSTYMERQKKIGMKKITEVEYIRTLLDIFINSCYSEYFSDKVENLIKLIEEQNIFLDLHKLFFLFPFSNIYQIYYSQIVAIVVNINSPKCLIDYFFYEKNQKKYLVDIYIENIISNLNFLFKQTNTKVLSPIFSFAINLLNKINNTDNLYLIENYLNKNDNFKAFEEIVGKDIEIIFNEKLLSSDKNYQGFNFSENIEEKMNYFGKKNFMELLEEDLDIYLKYKKGEEYHNILKEKQKRIEKEKEERKKNYEKKNEIIKKISDLDLNNDDDDDEDDPLFKIEKIKLQNDKNNFLAILNKPTEEVNQIMDNINNNNNNEEDKVQQEYNNEYDIKELENDEVNINEFKINEEIEPNQMHNKIYNTKLNKDLNEQEKEIKNNKENNNIKNENDKKYENINELGEVDDEIVDI